MDEGRSNPSCLVETFIPGKGMSAKPSVSLKGRKNFKKKTVV